MMKVINATSLSHDSHMIRRRAFHPRRELQHDVKLGIILGVIAVFACVFIAILLWRLNRWSRAERRLAEKQNRDLIGRDTTTSASDRNYLTDGLDIEEAGLSTQSFEKPLPRIPSTISMLPPGPTERSSRFVPRDVAPRLSKMYVHDITRPSRALSRQRSTRIHDSHINPYGAVPSPSIAHSRSISSRTSIVQSYVDQTNTTSSLNNLRSKFSIASDTSGSDLSGAVLGRFSVVNVTEADAPSFQRPRLMSKDQPPNYGAPVRGRDLPFSSKSIRGTPIVPTRNATDEKAESVYENDEVIKRVELSSEFPDTPSSYVFEIPVPQQPSRPPRSPLVPERTRIPLTITASYPVSSVVVENIRRPDGSASRGQLVTMSVIVDDDSPILGRQRGSSRYSAYPGNRLNQGDAYVTGNVLENYMVDLPPYTPSQENMTFAERRNEGGFNKI